VSCKDSDDKGGRASLADEGDAISVDKGVCCCSVSKVGRREGSSFTQREFGKSVGLAKGESITLELFPKADGVKAKEPPEGRRRCVDGFEVDAVAFERD